MHTREKGNKGEDIACIYLVKKGYVVVDRNYLRKWGELDIVAHKDSMLHFFEVKSVTYIPLGKVGSHSPEENVDGFKGHKLRRIIETYLEDRGSRYRKQLEKGIGAIENQEIDFQFHVLCVYMDIKNRKARVKMIENVIL